LHEDVEYRMEGGIVSVERVTDDAGRTVDRMAFEITLFDEADRMAARITNRWVLRR
jgi:hypothetical protein